MQQLIKKFFFTKLIIIFVYILGINKLLQYLNCFAEMNNDPLNN